MINLRDKLKKKNRAKEQESLASNHSSSLSITTQNSFLVEVENNQDIDDNIRREITKRFKKSIVNATYKFPRISESPAPSHALQKYSLKEAAARPVKALLRTFRFVSHTPKPSLNQSTQMKISKLGKREKHRKAVSVTPTPLSSIVKNQKTHNFPKLKFALKNSPYKISQRSN